MQDTKYGNFVSSLIPTLDRERIIGVRTPALRAFAKKLDPDSMSAYLAAEGHYYYEENNLHAFLIGRIGDIEKSVYETERFLPYVDNWATCDSMRPKIFRAHTKELYPTVEKWIKSQHTYTVRYGIGMLCSYYLDEAFDPSQLAFVSELESSEYYINMMSAWYFATALAKKRDAALPYFTEGKLHMPVRRMAVRKALESFRVSSTDKALLRTLLKKQDDKKDK